MKKYTTKKKSSKSLKGGNLVDFYTKLKNNVTILLTRRNAAFPESLQAAQKKVLAKIPLVYVRS